MAQHGVSILVSATAFAAEKHRNQRRKDEDASPYINHPIALASVLVNEAGIDDAVVIAAALLHDTIEDTATTPEELFETFGELIAGIVIEVTDDKTLQKAARKRLQVEGAPYLSRQAKLVKLADKICNLRDVRRRPPTTWSLERQREYLDWSKSVVKGLRDVHSRLEDLFDAEYAGRP